MSERNIQRDIELAIGSRPDCRIFRNNVGTAWTGKVTRLKNGSILIENPRPLHAGLMKGSGDLIGWQNIEITNAHLGMKIARFLSLEVKTSTGSASPEQKTWKDVVSRFGGIAAVVRSPDEAARVVGSP